MSAWEFKSGSTTRELLLLIGDVINGQRGSSPRERQILDVQTEAFNLFRKKNQDYGDAFADYGPVGVMVRMGDKIRRMVSITKSGVNLVEDEKLRDTLVDLCNYAAMAVLLMDEDAD
jgi:hypothetical protein